MFNIADLIVIMLILISALLGYKKGFIKTGFGVLSFFIALLLTFLLYQPVANIIKEKTGFEQWLYDYLYNLDFEKDEEDLEEEIETTDDAQNYIENLPDNVVNMFGLNQIKENAKNAIIEKIINFSVRLFAIIIVYITVRLGLTLLVFILNLFAKLPIIKQCNEILGILLGTFLGFLRMYSICAVITLISSLSFASSITNVINSSLFAHTFYDNNLLIKLLF